MKIPKKITPDRIRDSIVELRYVSKVPYEVAVGMFFQALNDTYKYTNRPAIPNQIPTLNKEITLSLGKHNLFYNDSIKIQIQPGSIIFNCVDNYVTWTNYKTEIHKVVEQVLKVDIIDQFTRIGVRYISDYEEMNLTDCVNFDFTFGMPEVQSKQYSFRTEFNSDGMRIILNLENNIPRNTIDNKTIPVSTIDVDAILEMNDVRELKNIMPLIEKVHDKEKEMFFTLLKTDFLKSLNPEY